MMNQPVKMTEGEKLFLETLRDLASGGEQSTDKVQASVKILSEYKFPLVIRHFVGALAEPTYKNKATILRACWENGADFSEHLGMFLNFVKDGTWEESIEAFSVIENTLGIQYERNRAILESLLPDNLNEISKERLPLFLQLFDLISNDSITLTE